MIKITRKRESGQERGGVYDAWAETEPLQALSGRTDQSEYAALWSAFFHQIGIKERENPACQRMHLPLRYRKYMTEFQFGSNRSNLAKL